VFARIVLIGVFLGLIAGFLGLGFWQLGRAEQRRELFAAFEADDGVIATELIDADAAVFRRYGRLELVGTYASDRQILLDWMTHEGRVGYQVLTPFRVTGSGAWVLVNRGWIAGAADHGTLPDVAVRESERVVRGMIDALPRPGLRRSTRQQESSTTWPRPLLYPTLEDIEAELGHPIAEYQLLLDAADDDGFVRAWRPRALKPQRHTGYAVQWFALATVLAGIGVGLLVRSARRRGAGKATLP